MSNFTVDDTDLGILYVGNTSEQCIGVCLGAGWDQSKLYDGTVTVVQEQSTVAHFSFAGTAIYVYFSAPANTVGTTQNAVFLVDGESDTQQISTFQIPPTQSGNYSILVYSMTMEDGYHVITITNGNFALDYLIYTSNGTPIITDSAPTQPSSTSSSALPSSQTSSTFLPSSPVVLSSSSLSSANSFSLTSSSSLPMTSAADSQSFATTRKTPVGVIAGASVASVVVALGVLVALLLYCRARKHNMTAPAESEPKYTSPAYLAPPPAGPSGSGAAPSPSNTMEEQLRQLQAEVELLRVDPWGARNSAISGSGDTASVTRSLSTMKSEQTRALLGQSYDHSTVRDSYLQTDGGLSLRAERDPDVVGPPRYE
ncbi:hypothetical protein DFH06DRAFT_752019 [Mycena polygramma]|nr:hypothetical protein DFH06DRAFT_752019 [Mycena polygramma]